MNKTKPEKSGYEKNKLQKFPSLSSAACFKQIKLDFEQVKMKL